MASAFTIRPAERRDADALGRLGALLMRTHYAFDPARFLAPGDRPERGYGRFLTSQLGRDDTVILVAEQEGAVVGYVYAGVEPMSWKELRDEAGFIHDVAVDPGARRQGIAARLVDEAAAWLVARGMPRVMLWTAAPNEAAQKLFERLGFRRTMIEMTRESVGSDGK
jgi:ribosomal protein S18 acetylase RimI-like enzyme